MKYSSNFKQAVQTFAENDSFLFLTRSSFCHEDMINNHSCTHNLSSYEMFIKAVSTFHKYPDSLGIVRGLTDTVNPPMSVPPHE